MAKKLCFMIALLASLATSAYAVVGPSSDPGSLAMNVVMVLARSGNSAGFCTGVVVARDVVLTAAHCVAGVADTRVHFRDETGGPALLAVAAVATHPGYRRDALRTRQRSIDLALVRLAAPLPERFLPAPLAIAEKTAVGERYRIAGYGLGREGVPQTGGVLRVAELAARSPLSSILLWAEDPSGQGAGACTGDSGAPVLMPQDGSVFAVVTWAAGNGGSHCGGLTQAVLVGPQRSWIDGVLAGWKTR